jgi:hypothetical protein
MNKAFLPINSRLQSLRSRSRVAPGGFRVIASPPGGDDPLSALLREMNETILGRTLTFESNVGAQMSVDVSGRRVLRLVSANGLADADACLAAETLDDDHKDDLLKLFQAIADPRHELRVSSTPITRSSDGVSVGLPVALLADLLLLDLNPSGEPTEPEAAPTAMPGEAALQPARTSRPISATPDLATARPSAFPVPETPDEPAPAEPGPKTQAQGLGTLGRSLGELALAWLIVGGPDDGATEGAEEMVSHVRGFLTSEGHAVRHQLDVMSGQDGGPVCLLLGAALIEGNSILCARMGDGLLLALIDGDATTHVLGAWRAVAG